MATKITEGVKQQVGDISLDQRLHALIPPEEKWTPVDRALYSQPDIYRVEQEKAEELRFEAIKYSFTHHYHNNGFYHRYCQTDGITPESIQTPEDLLRIPLIPDSFFKDYPEGKDFFNWLQMICSVKLPEVKLKRNPSFQDVMEALEAQEFTVTFTSGTHGKLSFFPRSKTTWSRQKYAMACAVKNVNIETYDPERIIMLCVPQADKTFNFLAKVTSAANNVFASPENMHYLITRKVTPDTIRISRGLTHGLKEKIMFKLSKRVQARMVKSFINLLEQSVAEKKKIALFGPPSILHSIMSRIEKENPHFKLGEDAYVLTGGGWKLATGAPMSDKEFRTRLQNFWGVQDHRCRDIYGMSECSSMMSDCKGHYKHIPQTVLYPMVLGENLKPLGYGEYGRFAFLDPLPESYPGFIITGDRVRMLESCPVCNRIGPVIESDISRMQGAESRGCSAVLGQMMANDIEEISKR
jgi:phenylacetate-coenzyme A ligase PaaK-like adenylate-forming protein